MLFARVFLGATSSATFTLRVGKNAAAGEVWGLNGFSSRVAGGSLDSFIRVNEYMT
jgi:hypothetical protein